MEMIEPFILCQLAFPICRLLVFMNQAVFSPQSLCKDFRIFFEDHGVHVIES